MALIPLLVALIPLLAWWLSFPYWLGGSYSLAGLVALIPLLVALIPLLAWWLLFPCWLGDSYSRAGLVCLIPMLLCGSYCRACLVSRIPLLLVEGNCIRQTQYADIRTQSSPNGFQSFKIHSSFFQVVHLAFVHL